MITLQAAEEEQAKAEARKVVQAALEQLPKWVTDNATTTATTTTSRKEHRQQGRNNELLLHLLRYST